MARIICAILILFIGVILQLLIGEFFGFWISFVLAALIASAFFLNLFEFLISTLLAVFMLNWQPAFSYEMTFFAALPFAVYFLRDALPYERWLSNLLFIFAAVLFMYLLFGPGIIVAATPIFIGELLAVALFGIFALKALEAVPA